MRILTSHDVRMIRTVLNEAGMVCHVCGCVDNVARLEISCELSMTWGNARNIIDTACFLIRNVCEDARITYVSGEDVGNDLVLVLDVGYEIAC